MVTASELLAHLDLPQDPLCPSCMLRRQDPNSPNGWCPSCDGRRSRQLIAKYKWWVNNRGAGSASA